MTKKAITIAYSKRENPDVYLFDILSVTDTNSFKVGCAAVNLATNKYNVHGCMDLGQNFVNECFKTARLLREVYK